MAIFINILKKKANLGIRLFLFTALLFFYMQMEAQSSSDRDLQTVYQHYLNFQLDSCQDLLSGISPTPQHFYLEILLSSTRIFMKDDISTFKSNKKLEDQWLKKVSSSNYSEPYKSFLQSEIKLKWAILKLKNGEELAAFWGLKQAYNLANENIQAHPDFMPSYKTMGILHILYGVFPDKYQWILSMFDIEGDVRAGLDELEKASKIHTPQAGGHDFLALESGLTKALMQAYLLNEPEKGAIKAQKIHEQNNYLLVDYAYALILIKNSQSGRALEITQAAEQKYPQPFTIAQMYYVKAETLLQQGKYDDAIQYYQRFLSEHSGKQLIKDSYHKIGICYWIMGASDQATTYFELAKKSGWAKNEADKNADHELKTNHLASRQLYQLRYTTDGGFYQNALKIHDEINPSLLKGQDKCDYFYRSARLFHKTENLQNAIKYYQKTMDCQHNKNWYFAPNSALQLGLIFIDQNNLPEAKHYLSLIRDYDNYPYENSIRQKAKTAMNDLK